MVGWNLIKIQSVLRKDYIVVPHVFTQMVSLSDYILSFRSFRMAANGKPFTGGEIAEYWENFIESEVEGDFSDTASLDEPTFVPDPEDDIEEEVVST